MENTLADFVEATLFNLMKYDFSLTKEVVLPVSYDLVGEEGEVHHLYSHPDALKQCRAAVKEKCPQAKVIETNSDALSAIQYLANPKESAALISTYAQKYHELPILSEKMEGEEKSCTTFFAIGKNPCPKKDKKYGTAFLLFSEASLTTEKQIAKLCLEKKIPLTKCKNLVLQEGHTPLYFVEVERHIEEKEVFLLFEALSEKYLVKNLGSFTK